MSAYDPKRPYARYWCRTRRGGGYVDDRVHFSLLLEQKAGRGVSRELTILQPERLLQHLGYTASAKLSVERKLWARSIGGLAATTWRLAAATTCALALR
jgi:hypothetical protein